jgi:Tfp pilus assembly protein PilN
MWYLLLRNWQYGVMGLLVVALMFLFLHTRYLNAKITTVESEKEALEQQLKTAKEQITACNGKLDVQNKAIDDLKIQSEERARRAAIEIERLRRIRDLSARKAEDIMKLQPQTGISLCDSANKIINEELKGAKTTR